MKMVATLRSGSGSTDIIVGRDLVAVLIDALAERRGEQLANTQSI